MSKFGPLLSCGSMARCNLFLHGAAMKRESEPMSDDGLIAREVGGWAETKHRLIALYDELFATGMKDKWDQRVYIDLYAGAGYNRIRGTNKIIAGSPILALTVAHAFDKYIFCDASEELLTALRQRVRRISPTANVEYVPGDCNAHITKILAAIPPASKTNTVLSLCFVDPFDLGIKFKTLRSLSRVYMDFLCLLALYMDANRNYSRYVAEEVDEFLGKKTWREAWRQAQAQGTEFPTFLAQQFADQMQTLGYIPPPLYTMKEVRFAEKNVPLYYLALFSRSQRAYELWDEVLKYSTDQISMF